VARRIISRVGETSDRAKQDILNLIGQIVKIGLLVFGAVTAFGTLGGKCCGAGRRLSLTGFALGFAFPDALSNLLAGILILFYRPFHRGDFIAITGFEGTVVGIDLRYTTLQGQGKTFLIPNSTLFTNCISLTKTMAIPPGAPECSPPKGTGDDLTIAAAFSAGLPTPDFGNVFPL